MAPRGINGAAYLPAVAGFLSGTFFGGAGGGEALLAGLRDSTTALGVSARFSAVAPERLPSAGVEAAGLETDQPAGGADSVAAAFGAIATRLELLDWSRPITKPSTKKMQHNNTVPKKRPRI